MTPYFAPGRALVAAIALSLTLAACGGDDDSDEGTAPPPEIEKPVTPPPAPQLRCAP
ncbi:hypothetical protein [Achromobacter denitrificans]|jgi:hypothetical protein|uniref:Lipoprotein n=1 Tax=Achromobacter denitrificans TaxID=32002 RepID=A0ABZ3G2V4_ACHDE|nr:hypothetical protein [Achromobacter denitrificans]MDX3880670.1 hypothetical protein [Achromobacter sp.]MBV2160763.1 hypothetical protein [Achromobacter denitrificans]MDF3941270.1 hypothetical protein [Achromobacter denitrificans]QKH45284.1 hypothetical protein FOC82_28930 [Achromobacter denitrificans]QKH53374.1 hypothetical protein FOC80_29540 [Achromobacter denitrificans]